MAYLPLMPKTKRRVNEYLAGMAARGFGVTPSMLRQACRSRPEDFEDAAD